MSNVLQNLFAKGKSPLSDQFMRWKIWNSWDNVVGPNMAGYSTPVGYSRRQLIIWVKSAAHMQDMSYGKDLLVNKVNTFVGFNWIDSVRLTLDRKDVPSTDESEAQMRQYLGRDDSP